MTPERLYGIFLIVIGALLVLIASGILQGIGIAWVIIGAFSAIFNRTITGAFLLKGFKRLRKR